MGVGRGGGHLGVSGAAKREYGDESALYDVLDEEEGDSASTGSYLSRGGVRKKQKVEMPGEEEGEEEEEEGFGVGRQEGYALPPPITIGHHEHDAQYRDAGASPHIHAPPHQAHHNQQAASVSRETLLQGEVYNSHDALHLLYEAAGRDASGPPSPKLKSESGDNEDDEDAGEDDDDEDEGGDEDHIMNDAPQSNNDIMRQPSTLAASRSAADIGNAYPGQYDDADGRTSSINPISHFNGPISTSTSFLRGTGRPGVLKPTPKEATQPALRTTGAQVNSSPISPVNARASQSQQVLQHPPAQPAATKNRVSFSQRCVVSEKSSIHGGDDREGMQVAIKAWGKSRFVKSGWFTAKEAIGYVD